MKHDALYRGQKPRFLPSFRNQLIVEGDSIRSGSPNTLFSRSLIQNADAYQIKSSITLAKHLSQTM